MTTFEYHPQLDRHVQQLRSLKWQPFFTGFKTVPSGNRCAYAVRRYPRDIEPRSVESLEGSYKWELSPCNRHGMAGGSKLRSYRIARQRIAYNRSYLNQRYSVFAGPVGWLP